jgi:hypothetical protein
MGNIKDATTKVVHNGERVVNNGRSYRSIVLECIL